MIVTGYILSVIIIFGGNLMEISELINLIANVGFPVAIKLISSLISIRLPPKIIITLNIYPATIIF